jgi:hypothetical protein
VQDDRDIEAATRIARSPLGALDVEVVERDAEVGQAARAEIMAAGGGVVP